MILHDSIQLYDTIIQNVLTSKNTTKIKIANKTYITFFVQEKYFWSMHVTAHSFKENLPQASRHPPESHTALLSISPKSVQYAHLENTKLKKL